jgi:hypothetical protein
METKRVSPYTYELLMNILEEGGAKLTGSYKKFNQRMIIDFICKCGANANKRFEMLKLHRVPYCNKCSLKEHSKRTTQTCVEKYNVTNIMYLQEYKDKITDTFMQKYGDHPKRNKEVQDKWKETCLKKYGGHPNQNIEVQAKSEATAYSYKDYMMPSGKVIKYQGYENLALDDLINIYDEDDIILGRSSIPTIEYNVGDVKHVYFPDIYIKSENKIIEVKSEWTIKLKRGNVEEKALATIKAGYKYEIWVYSDKKLKIETKVY